MPSDHLSDSPSPTFGEQRGFGPRRAPEPGRRESATFPATAEGYAALPPHGSVVPGTFDTSGAGVFVGALGPSGLVAPGGGGVSGVVPVGDGPIL